MTTPKRIALSPALLGGLLVLLSGCAGTAITPYYQHAQFHAHSPAIKTVAVATPNVTLVRRGVGSAGRLHPDEQRVADELRALVVSALSNRGFATKTPEVTRETRDHLRRAYKLIDYDQTKALHSTPGGTYELGPEIAAVAEQAGADAVIFVAFKGVTRSGASVATELTLKFMIGIGTGVTVPKDPSGAAILVVTLADGKSGEVLWEERVAEIWNILIPDFDRQELAEMVNKVFAKFPHKP